jgi:hypothetical protein
MKRRFSGPLAGAAVVALVAAGGASASTLSTSASSAAPASSAARSSVAGSRAQVTLVTGDEVTLTTLPGGRQTASIAAASRTGASGVFQTFNLGHDLYVVPENAAPYLGSTLSPSLFDVTQLAKHPAAALRLTETLRSATASAALPGATVTRTGATSATAVFTRTSAQQFGRALAAQALRDHASATHMTGLFADLSRLSTATTAPAPKAKPGATYTLTLKGINWAGAPDNGDSANIYNVDDLSIQADPPSVNFTNGVATSSVAPGNYSVVSFFYDFTTGNIYGVILPQFAVKKNTTETVDATKATAQVTVSTPKPADTQVQAVGVGRIDAKGVAGTYSFTAGATNTFYMEPTKKAPTVGQLESYVYDRAFSPAGTKNPYTYDLKFPGPDGTISADQSYAAKAKSLETTNASYRADHTGQVGLETRFAALPWETFLIGSDLSITLPTARTEYYSTNPDVVWAGLLYQVYISTPFTLLGEIDSSWTTYKAGAKSTEVWAGDPTHARLLQTPIYVNQTICPVCASSSALDVIAFPFGDNSDNHRTYPDGAAAGLTESETWGIKGDGKSLGSGTGFFQDTVAPGSAKTFAISYDTARSSSDFTLSTESDTTWTVQAAAPRPDLPSGWVCSPSGDTDCSVLPVMTTDYQLPTTPTGQLSSGDVKAGLTIGHLAGAKAKVTKVTVSVSFDGGKTWTKATVTKAGAGQYTVAFTVPAKGQTDGFGALKVSASDSYKGSIKESVINAFSVK